MISRAHFFGTGRPGRNRTARGSEVRARGSCSRPHGGVVVDGAFTLLEVLVALCIFAMAAVVLGSSYLNVLTSYESVSRSMKTNEDFAFARQLVLREPDRKKLEQGGEFDTAKGGHARWSAEITSTTMPNVFNVGFTCEISDTTGGEPQKVTQNLTVLRPTWVIDTGERDKLKQEVKARIYELQGKKLQ